MQGEADGDKPVAWACALAVPPCVWAVPGEVAPADTPAEALSEQGGGSAAEGWRRCSQQEQPGALNGWHSWVLVHRTEQTCKFFGEDLALWPHYYIWWCQLLILCVSTFNSSLLAPWWLALNVSPHSWSLQRISSISSFTYHSVFPSVKLK